MPAYLYRVTLLLVDLGELIQSYEWMKLYKLMQLGISFQLKEQNCHSSSPKFLLLYFDPHLSEVAGVRK